MLSRFDHTADLLVLERAEFTLRESLKRENASPYLGHHEIANHEEVLHALRKSIATEFDNLKNRFQKVPRTVIWAVATSLSSGYGKDGDHACYPLIAEVFGLNEIPQGQPRKWFHGKFRRECGRLGLTIPAIDEEVGDYRALDIDDYFAQSGIAVNQLPAIAEMFKKAEARWGPPPVDATSELTRWENDAVEHFCPHGLNRPRKVLLFDGTSYHSALYARLREGELPRSRFEQEFLERIESARPPKLIHSPRPVLVYLEGQLAISDFRGGSGFELDIAGARTWIRPGVIERLPVPWPAAVAWRDPKDDVLQELTPYLGVDVQYLVFDGKRGDLIHAVPQDAPTEIKVGMGEIAVLSREPFQIGGRDAVENTAGCFELYHDVQHRATLHGSGTTISVFGIDRPRMELAGGTRLGRHGQHEWVAGIQSVEVSYSRSDQNHTTALEAQLIHPALAGGNIILRLAPKSGAPGVWVAAIAEALPQAGFFGLLRVGIRQVGEERILLRGAAWIWPGLTGLEEGERFVAVNVPENWDEKRSLNIERNGNTLKLADPSSVPYLNARVVFRVGTESDDSSTADASFEFRPPGVSIVLREADGTERSLRLGQTLALAPDDGATVIVRAPDQGGSLDIQGRRDFPAFDRFGFRHLSTAGLSGVREHQEIRYSHPRTQERWHTLLVVKPLAAPTMFTPIARATEIGFCATFQQPVKGVRICSRGLLRDSLITIDPNSFGVKIQFADEARTVEVIWDESLLGADDLYILTPQVQFADGRWRGLSNARRDFYEWAVAHRLSMGQGALPIDMAEHPNAFRRTGQVLDRCIAEPCWATIETGVLPVWRTLSREMSNWYGLWKKVLLESSMTQWSADGSTTWIPICHPLELSAELLEAPAADFHDLSGPNSTEGAKELAWFAKVDGTQNALAAIIAADANLMVVAGAFANVAAAQGDVPLAGFDFERYSAALGNVPEDVRDSLWTDRQERLSQSHHTWCSARLMERVTRIRRPGYNQVRLRDVKELSLVARPAAHSMWGRRPIALDPPRAHSMEWESLPDVVPLVSAWSRAAREERTAELLQLLCQRSGLGKETVLRTVGLLLRLGPELFGFYLLLWEIAARGERQDG